MCDTHKNINNDDKVSILLQQLLPQMCNSAVYCPGSHTLTDTLPAQAGSLRTGEVYALDNAGIPAQLQGQRP